MARSTEPKRDQGAARSRTAARRAPARSKPAAGGAARRTQPAKPVEPEVTAADATRAAERPAAPEAVAGAAAAEAVAAPETAAASEPPNEAVASADPEPSAPLEASAGAAARPGSVPDAAVEALSAAAKAGTGAASRRVAAALEDAAAARAAPRGDAGLPAPALLGGALRLQEQMMAFTCRQAEVGLAAGRALLANRSLPGLLALQTEFVGRSFDNALAHGLELARLSGDMLREGLRRPR